MGRCTHQINFLGSLYRALCCNFHTTCDFLGGCTLFANRSGHRTTDVADFTDLCFRFAGHNSEARCFDNGPEAAIVRLMR